MSVIHTLLILIIGICMILFAGCVMSSQSQAPEIPAVNTPYGSTGGKDVSGSIPKFDAYAEQVFNKSRVPGMAVAVVKNDTVIYLRVFGVKNITTREPVGPDTRFQLASISKTFSSASIASMVGREELSWDDPVGSLYPGFQLSDPWVTDHVTIRDLLMHRTGLPHAPDGTSCLCRR